MDLGQVEGTRGGDILAHEGFVGRRLTLSYRCGPPELNYIRVVILGLVLCRWCQGGAGWRWEISWNPVRKAPGQESSEPGGTPRGCQRTWSFFIMGRKSFQGRAGSQFSLPATWCVLSFL